MPVRKNPFWPLIDGRRIEEATPAQKEREDFSTISTEKVHENREKNESVPEVCFDCLDNLPINLDERSKQLDPKSLKEIMDTSFKSKSALITDLIYEGTYILAGAPKTGKSFLAAQIAYHTATGQPLWGLDVKQGAVLYFALEDTYPRIQARFRLMFGNLFAPENLFFTTITQKLENGFLKELDKFLELHRDVVLVIVDTWQMIRESSVAYSYSKDYKAVSLLKKYFDSKEITLLLVHHNRKQKSEDVFEMISGTTGIFGCVDGAMILTKNQRTAPTALLSVTGRDQPDQTIKLKRNTETLAWDYIETVNEEFETCANPLLDAVVGFINPNNPSWKGTATELVKVLGLSVSANSLSRSLNAMSKELLGFGIEYTNTRSHDGRKISLSLLPSEEADDLLKPE